MTPASWNLCRVVIRRGPHGRPVIRLAGIVALIVGVVGAIVVAIKSR